MLLVDYVTNPKINYEFVDVLTILNVCSLLCYDHLFSILLIVRYMARKMLFTTIYKLTLSYLGLRSSK